MSNELSTQNILPALNKKELIQDKLRSSTFISIDFGTSTIVISYAIVGDDKEPMKLII